MKSIYMFLFILLSAQAHAGWNYQRPMDKISGEKGLLASTTSLNNVVSSFGIKDHAILVVKEHPRYGEQIILVLKRSQFVCESEGCDIKIRFDNQEPISKKGYEPDDGNTSVLNLGYSEDFLRSLIDSKVMHIEVPIYRGGRQVIDFNTSNLKWERPKELNPNEMVDRDYKCMMAAKKFTDVEEQIGFEERCQLNPDKLLKHGQSGSTH